MIEASVLFLPKLLLNCFVKICSPHTCLYMYSWESLISELWILAAIRPGPGVKISLCPMSPGSDDVTMPLSFITNVSQDNLILLHSPHPPISTLSLMWTLGFSSAVLTSLLDFSSHTFQSQHYIHLTRGLRRFDDFQKKKNIDKDISRKITG